MLGDLEGADGTSNSKRIYSEYVDSTHETLVFPLILTLHGCIHTGREYTAETAHDRHTLTAESRVPRHKRTALPCNVRKYYISVGRCIE